MLEARKTLTPSPLPARDMGAARTVIVCGAVLSTPVAALAQEAGAHGGGLSPFAGDVGTAIWTVVIFVGVVLVLGKFAWGPILKALQRREDFIRDSLEQANRNREEAEARLKEYAKKLEDARAEAAAIVQEARHAAEALKQKLEGDAKTEASATLDRARREIDLATETAVKQLYALSTRLATEVAARIIRKELDPKDQERLVQESIAELEKVSLS